MAIKQETKATTTHTPKQNLRYQRDKDREKVRGVFRYYEVPGGVMSFVHKAYKEDEVERYDLIDGEIYTLPLGVAKHLNTNGWYPEYNYVPGENNVQTGVTVGSHFSANFVGHSARIGRKVRRFGFQSLEFMDVEELAPAQQIVTVEHGV